MDKLDLKKEKSDLFKGKDGEIREVFSPKSYYICLDGEGDPNTSLRYNDAVGALYKVGYTLKFMFKEKELDFVVMPLSSLWWVKGSNEMMTEANKDKWSWRAMIELPDYISEEDIELAKNIAYEKEPNEIIKEILHREMNENKCFQVLHIGPYNEENEKVSKMHELIKEKGCLLRGLHHEIYLNDPRKVEPSKIKTIIRQPVYKEDEERLDFNIKKEEFFEGVGKSKKMVLSTTDGEKVSSRFMCVICDSERFYFQTDLDFRKCRDIEKNKNIALCVNNIQIEGEVINRYSFYDEEVKNFRNLYKEYNNGSYNAYSKLMNNAVFEVKPKIVQFYTYENDNVSIEILDFEKKKAYRKPYLVY